MEKKKVDLITVDQSLSKFAYVFWFGGEVVHKGVFYSGKSSNKTKYKHVTYFDTVDEQIDFLLESLMVELQDFEVQVDVGFAMEGLSFSSSGNATRDLSGLYYRLRKQISSKLAIAYNDIKVYAPTTLKAESRKYLPVEDQTTVNSKGKTVKTKMGKPEMIKACTNIAGEDFLKGYTLSKGKDDLADAFLVGKLYLEREV